MRLAPEQQLRAQSQPQLRRYNTVEAGDRAFLLWRGTVSDRDVEGATMIVAGDGLVIDRTVRMRSWTVVGMFRDAMHLATGQTFEARDWRRGGEQVPAPTLAAGSVGLRLNGSWRRKHGSTARCSRSRDDANA